MPPQSRFLVPQSTLLALIDRAPPQQMPPNQPSTHQRKAHATTGEALLWAKSKTTPVAIKRNSAHFESNSHHR